MDEDTLLELALNGGVPDDVDGDIVSEVIEYEDGSTDIVFTSAEDMAAESDIIDTDPAMHYENLAVYLTEEDLDLIANDVLERYEEDEISRHGHIQQLVDGIDQLGLDDSHVATPFEGACTVFHPLLIENAVKFQAKATTELLPANGPVKTQIIGDLTPELEKQALDIKTHMNWQLTQEMSEFEPNSERTFFQAALLGDCFKKKYFCPVSNRVKDRIIPIDKFVANSSVQSLESADCLTEIIPMTERDVMLYQESGAFLADVDLGEPYAIEKSEIQERLDQLLGLDAEAGEGFTILEQHTYLTLPFEETEIPLPYVVCVDKRSRKVLSIRRNWRQGGDKNVKREWYSHYGFVPAFGFYHLGMVHLLGNFQRTLTAILRSLIDAGQFANMQGGFKARNLRILGEETPHSPGEWKSVENFGKDIGSSFFQLSYKEPSATLFQLLEFVESRGQKFADSTESVIADSTNYGPVGTTMALLDASTKFFSAVHKRMFKSQSSELRILAELNHENLPDDPEGIKFNIPGQTVRITRAHYDERIDVIPVSDPNVSSQAHRITLAQTKVQAAQQAPQIHDLREVYKDFYVSLGETKIDKLMPVPEEAQPRSPVEDIQLASQGKPIRAFPDQDHDAHIEIKVAFLNDPTLGASPLMAAARPAIEANIREHMVLKFQTQMQGAMSLGVGESEAAKQIAEFNTFKANNPMGADDPKVMIAKAEMMKAENDSKKLGIMERKEKIKALTELMGVQLNIRDQDIDMAKHELSLKSDQELTKLQSAMQLINEAIKPKPPSKSV